MPDVMAGNEMNKDHVGVVTGGTRGIGLALAKEMLRSGAKVAILYRKDKKSAERLRGELDVDESRFRILQCDVSDIQAVRKTFSAVESELGPVEYLVNNAGILIDSPLYLMEDTDWHEVVGVSLAGTYNTCRTIITGMMKRESGRIVNIVSASLFYSSLGQTNYLAGKGGVAAFTKALAREVAGFGITVNAIAPGFIDTDMTKDIPEDKRRELIARIPVKRFGIPQEIADVAMFLISDRAAYITGQVLAVDGGWTS